MSVTVQRADWFKEDFDRQYRWYLAKAGETVAEGYLAAVERTVAELERHPLAGRPRHFRHAELQDIRSFCMERPFHKHILFYRSAGNVLSIERVMHGARNLPRRLMEPPGARRE